MAEAGGVKNVSAMTLAEVQAELRSYQPGNAAEVVTTDEHKTRRQQLWRRLDRLVKIAQAVERVA